MEICCRMDGMSRRVYEITKREVGYDFFLIQVPNLYSLTPNTMLQERYTAKISEKLWNSTTSRLHPLSK
jgi:hypothetical protein